MSAIKDWAWKRCEELYILGYEVEDIAKIMNVDTDFVKVVLNLEEE